MGEKYVMIQIRYLLLTLCLSSLLVSCASTKEDIFEGKDRKTMVEIHDEAFGASKPLIEESDIHEINDGVVDLSGYTRTSATELQILFRKLPNPDLVMYVYPHITDSNLPIAGYATSFTMYRKQHYALPGEMRE